MYYSSKISVNPTQETQIDIVKPTKAFARIFNAMTLGSLDKKKERETFTAISILQSFNSILRKRGIENIIRLSCDGIPVYEDKHGVDDDLKEAVEAFELEYDSISSELFETLGLVLEHEDRDFKYLIQIDVKRVHEVDEDPISLIVNGVPVELGRPKSEAAKLKKELSSNVFSSQKDVDLYLETRQVVFDQFVASLDMEVRSFIHSESITKESRKNIVRSAKTGKKSRSHGSYNDPIFIDHYNDSILLNIILWSELSELNNIHYHDVSVISEEGDTLAEIGNEALGLEDAMTAEEASDFGGGDDSSDSDKVSSGFFSSDSFSDSDSGGSSCSSCSSCGGD